MSRVYGDMSNGPSKYMVLDNAKLKGVCRTSEHISFFARPTAWLMGARQGRISIFPIATRRAGMLRG